MARQVILPPTYENVPGPLIFLAGPIQGAAPWQAQAIEFIHAKSENIAIANPRRDYLSGEFDYDAQVDWESHHLRAAASNGVILFWLASESLHRCDRAYAQTTRFELAEWKVRHERDGTRLVIGIDDAFTGARYIRRRFGLDCPAVPIFNSLQAACDAAVALVNVPT